jgi:hypothetical protein
MMNCPVLCRFVSVLLARSTPPLELLIDPVAHDWRVSG